MATTTAIAEWEGPTPRGARSAGPDRQLHSQVSLLHGQVARLNAKSIKLAAAVEACDADGLVLLRDKEDLYRELHHRAGQDPDRQDLDRWRDEFLRRLTSWQLRARAWVDRVDTREHELRLHLSDVDLREIEAEAAATLLIAEGATGVIAPSFERPRPRHALSLWDYDRITAAAQAQDIDKARAGRGQMAPIDEAHQAYMDLFGW